MFLHTDIPSRTQVDRLIQARNPASVSLYIPTLPTSGGEAERLVLRNQTAEAVRRLLAAGVSKRAVAEVEEGLLALIDDRDLWQYMARSLAIFATPDSVVTFRLPNELSERLQAADRFALKPLLRSVTFPQLAYVLALAQNSVRLLAVQPEDAPTEVDVPGLPQDIASAIGLDSIRGRGVTPRGKIQGSEGQKVRMNQYARKIDEALRPVLRGDVPLILAAAEPLASIFRNASSMPQLAHTTLRGNPEGTSDGELAAEARTVLDEIYMERLQGVLDLYSRRRGEGRASADLASVARAATYGMVDTVLVDIDRAIPGTVDDASGAVQFTEEGGAAGYGVVDEIANRVWLHGGTVMAVRGVHIPDGSPLAAIMRYAAVPS